MITLLLLLILLVVTIIVVGIGGLTILLPFLDCFVAIIIVVWLCKKIFGKKK